MLPRLDPHKHNNVESLQRLPAESLRGSHSQSLSAQVSLPSVLKKWQLPSNPEGEHVLGDSVKALHPSSKTSVPLLPIVIAVHPRCSMHLRRQSSVNMRLYRNLGRLQQNRAHRQLPGLCRIMLFLKTAHHYGLRGTALAASQMPQIHTNRTLTWRQKSRQQPDSAALPSMSGVQKCCLHHQLSGHRGPKALGKEQAPDNRTWPLSVHLE